MREFPTSYNNPLVIDHGVGSFFDFGTAGDVYVFKGPKGKKGRLIDVIASAIETFTATTTSAKIKIGTGSDDDAYGSFDLGTLADSDCFVGSADQPEGFIDQELPADTEIVVTFVAPTGGTPAGMAKVSIPVAWY